MVLYPKCFFDKPGDVASARMQDTDNYGLWSSIYIGIQAFRYAVTKEKKVKRFAWETFYAFERLIFVNPLKVFLPALLKE
jgi:hypothetical protein